MKQYVIDNIMYNIKILNELFVTGEDIGLTIVEPFEFIVRATNC